MKFAATTLCVLLTASFANATLRGNSAIKNDGRHLLGADTECIPHYKVMHYKDKAPEGSWDCELSEDDAAAVGSKFVKIAGISNEEMVKRGAVSVESVLLVGADSYIQGNQHARNSLGGSAVLHVEGSFEVEHMDENDTRHHRNRKARRNRERRDLADSTGTLKTLVVRVIDGKNKSPPSANKLDNDIFVDSVSLKKQFEKCSYGNINIQKTDEGIIDIKVSSAGNGKESSKDTLMGEAYTAIESKFNSWDQIRQKFDLLMYCLPGSTGDDWVAYAYVNGETSVYNNEWCSSVSAQMHEVGHNIGLDHSGIKGLGEYTDGTGAMGYAYRDDDFPSFCFNAAKQYQLGWYPAMTAQLDPLNIPGGKKKFILNGIVDYDENNTNEDKVVSLRLKFRGNKGGSDFYIGYNRATGFNEETQDEANKVHVIEKENPYADWYGYNGEGLSWRVAALGEGEVYSWEMGSQRVKVKVSRISGKNAIVWVHGGNSEDEPSEDEPAKCNEKPTRSFVLKSGTRKTCANVSSKKGSSRKKFCGVTTDTRNKKVHQFCPKSCGEVGVGACA